MEFPRLLRFFRAVGATGLACFLSLGGAACASGECKFNSECGDNGRCIEGSCQSECLGPIDCPKSRPFCVRGVCEASEGDASVTPDASDGGGSDSTSDGPVPDAPPDTAVTDTSAPDTGIDTGVEDTSTPPPDTTSGGKPYLTKCTTGADCASGLCTSSSPRFCTKTCSSTAECANGQICAGGACRLDDTGFPSCDVTTAAPCGEFCYGSPTAKHCTKSCATALDCPAGFACTTAGAASPGKKVCVEIEKPCAAPEQCVTGLGFCGSGGLGCTARCTSALECPHRLVGLPPYQCQNVGGQQVCVPPSDVLGSDPLGALCSAASTNTCRSGACDDGVSPATCAQRCTTRGGCPTGYACFPLEDPGKSALLVCSPAGAAWLGEPCAKGRDCATALCQSPGYCTRLCDDGYCPEGMTCVPAGLSATDGTPIKLCSK